MGRRDVDELIIIIIIIIIIKRTVLVFEMCIGIVVVVVVNSERACTLLLFSRKSLFSLFFLPSTEREGDFERKAYQTLNFSFSPAKINIFF
jgi:hypothetical protein